MRGKLISVIFNSVIGAIGLGFVFLVIAALYGGNYATDFTFAGQRGYEATGALGALIGLILGGALGSGAHLLLFKKQSAISNVVYTSLIGLSAGPIIFIMLWGRSIF